MGRFKSNVLAQRHCHRPPRDSLDLDGRLSGSLAAFKFAISAGFEKIRSESFWKAFAPRPILLFQKMRGWLRVEIGHSSETRNLAHTLAGLAVAGDACHDIGFRNSLEVNRLSPFHEHPTSIMGGSRWQRGKIIREIPHASVSRFAAALHIYCFESGLSRTCAA
jgi:hypothetical protein